MNGKPDVDVLREHLFHEGRLHEEDVVRILGAANEVFRGEENVLTIEAPIASFVFVFFFVVVVVLLLFFLLFFFVVFFCCFFCCCFFWNCFFF